MTTTTITPGGPRGAHRTETVIVGAGQAGLAMSRALSDRGRPHVVLERGRVGERWRSERWDSLTLLTPDWANLLPGQARREGQDGFATRQGFVDALDEYASSFHAPVVERVTVVGLRAAGHGLHVETDRGAWQARNVVVATGDCDVPRVPHHAAVLPSGVESLPASRYRTPSALGPGGVLVVGAGPTGQQLALELARAGREVTIAAGRLTRTPRRYRGRDIWHWLTALGDFDVRVGDVPNPEAARRTPSLALTGANGGEELDLGVLAAAGVTIAGRLTGIAGRHALFGDGLWREVAAADRRLERLLDRIDALVDDGPADDRPPPGLRPEPLRLPAPPGRIDLRAAGIGTVVWATGYRRSYPWVRLPVLDREGEIVQREGRTRVPGLYTLGLKFQSRRSSHFIGGVGTDAISIADEIAATRRQAGGPCAVLGVRRLPHGPAVGLG